jgi:hypothetical protein
VACIIDPAGATGTPGNAFVFQPDATGGDFSVLILATGTLTSLSGDVEVSLNAGTTWTKLSVAFITAAAAAKVLTPAIGNAWYRINATAGAGPYVITVIAN